MTAPWPADVATLPTGPHTVEVRAEALPVTGPAIPLELSSLRIGWDEARAPRCTATLVAPLTDDTLVTVLDPRLRPRVRILAGYRLANGTLSEQTLATLDVRTVTEDQPDDTLTITAGGVETRVMDKALPLLTSGSAVSRRALIFDALYGVWFPEQPPLRIASAVGDVVDDFDGSADSDAWSQLDGLVDELAADIYDPGDGTIVVAGRPETAGPTVHTLRTGPGGGTLTRVRSGRSREGWHNAVHIKFDNGGDPTTWVYGNADATGPYAPTNPGIGNVFFVETRRAKRTQAAANRIAAAVLARQLTGGRTYDASAVAAWWVRPGHTVSVETARDVLERHLVARVEFSWPANEMTLTTRQPGGL